MRAAGSLYAEQMTGHASTVRDAGTDAAWRAFARLAAVRRDVFFLDAGAAATTGRSLVGVGTPAAVADALQAPLAGDPSRRVGDDRLVGGYVGWFSYEDGVRASGDAPIAPGGERSAVLRVEAVAVFDHGAGNVTVEEGVAGAGDDLRGVLGHEASDPLLFSDVPLGQRAARARTTPDEYAVLIARCRAEIRAGNAYQLCLTTRFSIDAPDIDALAVYARLRASVGAQRGGFVRIGDTALLSASPEQFLGVRGGTVTTRPIKGTRPRGSDAVSDQRLARELAESAKERAENVMIVDLMRNDLARACVPGTVAVPALLEVESYPHVHQLVSTVTGTLRPGTTLGDLLRVAFPAGSMTGAPKLSAITILHALEREPRGMYAGCFGWIGAGASVASGSGSGSGSDFADADLAMVIRSIVLVGSGAEARAYVGAGGGITWGSVAADEVAEVALKARGPLAALGAALPEDWVATLGEALADDGARGEASIIDPRPHHAVPATSR